MAGSEEGVASVSVSLIASRLPPSFYPTDSPPHMRAHFATDITASSLYVSEVALDLEPLLRSDNPLILPLFITPPPSPSSTTSTSHARRSRIDHPVLGQSTHSWE